MIRIALVTKWNRQFSEISFLCIIYFTSFSNTGERTLTARFLGRFNPGICFVETAKQLCEGVNLWKYATLELERLLSVPSKSPYGHFLRKATHQATMAP